MLLKLYTTMPLKISDYFSVCSTKSAKTHFGVKLSVKLQSAREGVSPRFSEATFDIDVKLEVIW